MSISSANPSTSPVDVQLSAHDGEVHPEGQREQEANRGNDRKPDGDTRSGGRHIDEDEIESNMSIPFDENVFSSATARQQEPTPTFDGLEYEQAATNEMLPPPDFKPYFTLIEDPGTGRYYHPHVHYMFSDDDQEILTSAVLENFQTTGDGHASRQTPDDSPERYIIVDVAANGKTITAAASLSADWQALKTTTTAAPSWGDESNSADRGLMLTISGRKSDIDHFTRADGQLDPHQGDIHGLIQTFNERLARLDEVIEKHERQAPAVTY